MAFFLSASSRPAISFCNLEKRHEGCRTWAGLAVPAAAVETPAHAVSETATKTRMHKAGASEPRMEEARVTKAEASEGHFWMSISRLSNARARASGRFPARVPKVPTPPAGQAG